MIITVRGIPGPQGSKRFVGLGKRGRGIMVESSNKVKPWRDAVCLAAIEQLRGAGPIEGPVDLHIVFALPAPKRGQGSRCGDWHTKRPDLSKLIRSTEDALTDAGVWRDDSQVVRVTAGKGYDGDDARIPTTGAYIEIRSLIP